MTKGIVEGAKEIASPYSRHLGIFNPHENKISATIIGCGAIGSFVAVGLAKMGVKEQVLYDFDTVEDVNLPVQLHVKSCIGVNKAKASRDLIAECCPEDPDIEVHEEKWEGQKITTDIVVSAVDCLKVRKAIWDSVKYDGKIKLLSDARIGGQMMKLFAINPVESKDIEEYDKSLKSTEGSELPCTERGVIDVSLFASALMIRAIRRWIVSHEKETYLVYNLAGPFKSIIG